jgi:hypothetical protein
MGVLTMNEARRIASRGRRTALNRRRRLAIPAIRNRFAQLPAAPKLALRRPEQHRRPGIAAAGKNIS